jgi:hypothetical protein
VAQSLGEVGFRSTLGLMSTYAGRRVDLAPWLEGAAINRDRKPWLQYQAGLESYTPQEADVFRAMTAYRRFPDDLFAGSGALKQALKAAGQPPKTGP